MNIQFQVSTDVFLQNNNNLSFAFLRNEILVTSLSGSILLNQQHIHRPKLIFQNLENRDDGLGNSNAEAHCSGDFMLKGGKLDCNISHINYIFRINAYLAMNFTFDILKTTTNIFLCSMNNVNISHSLMDLVFCGHHSKFGVFPSGNTIEMNINVQLNDKCQFWMQGTHQVLDKNVVFTRYNELPNISPSCNEIIQQSVIPKSQTYINLFKYKVMKADIILVYVNRYSNDVVVHAFDGPNMLTEATNLFKDDNKICTVWSSSTFQCLLQTIGKQEDVANMTIHMKTTSNVNTLAKVTRLSKYPEESKTVLFPSASCHKEQGHIEVCGHRLEVPAGFSINLTISHLMYRGLSGFECQLGGLSIFEGNFSKEMVSLCKNFSSEANESFPSRSIYSSTNMLSLVSHTYDNNTRLTMRAIVQPLSCKVVTHELQKNCWMGNRLKESFVASSCLVFQFGSDIKMLKSELNPLIRDFWIHRCQASFIPVMTLNPQITYNFQVSGFLQKDTYADKSIKIYGCPEIKNSNTNITVPASCDKMDDESDS